MPTNDSTRAIHFQATNHLQERSPNCKDCRGYRSYPVLTGSRSKYKKNESFTRLFSDFAFTTATIPLNNPTHLQNPFINVMPPKTMAENGEENEEKSMKEEQSSTNIPATFQGRLNLADFAFTAKPSTTSTSPTPRRSPRKPTTDSSQSLPVTNKRRSTHLSTTKSPSPSKKARSPSGYAPPEIYAHLPPLPDVIAPGLLILFIGLNPGLQTSIQGHAYAHPSNLFWKLLHSSGLTTRRMLATEDRSLPELYSMGYTNIVARPTRNGAELSKAEMDASVSVLEDKIRRFRPEVVCVVGKSIWESIWRVRYGRPIKKEEFSYGWQDERENMGVVAGDEATRWQGAKVFAATSTSGLAANPLPAEKERIWRELGSWAEQRRVERVGIRTVSDTREV